MKFQNKNIAKQLKLFSLVVVLFSSTLMSGCIKSNAATRFAFDQNADVSEATIKQVNLAFRKSFLGGDWYYQGAQAMNGTVNAYIQIPTRLEMAEKEQKNYLKMAICPKRDKVQMWQSLKEIPLSVHIYTSNKKFTVYAHCENPLV